MIRTYAVLSLAAASLLNWAAPVRAEVFIRAPFVLLRVGRPGPPTEPRVAVALPGLVGISVSGSLSPVVAPPPVALAREQVPPPIVSVPTPLERPAVASPNIPLPPPAIVVPALPAPAPAVVRPIRHEDFAATFQPAPGNYEVVFLHPGSKCPVTVCFTLPEGCPKVHVHKRTLEFDYGRQCVRIRFQIGGKVKVTYD